MGRPDAKQQATESVPWVFVQHQALRAGTGRSLRAAPRSAPGVKVGQTLRSAYLAKSASVAVSAFYVHQEGVRAYPVVLHGLGGRIAFHQRVEGTHVGNVH